MKAFRGIFTLLLLVGWVNQGGALACGRPKPDHPACPMHVASGGTGLHVESASRDACHDAGSSSHCVSGQSCTVSLDALSPHIGTRDQCMPLRFVAHAPAARWRSGHIARTAPPPRPANRAA